LAAYQNASRNPTLPQKSVCPVLVSPVTALRDIAELLIRGVLCKASAGGRITGYELLVDLYVQYFHSVMLLHTYI